ncbi:Phosphate acyltransferase [uncultured archaeon]|nr:Phosphate acyltransferase [uncultured archaeon]
MAQNDRNVGIDMSGGDPDDNGVPHLDRAIEALEKVSTEFEGQPVRFFAYVEKENSHKVEAVFAGRTNVTVVGDIEKEFPMDKTPEEMANIDTTILRLSRDLKQTVQTDRTRYLDVIYSSGQSAAAVRYAFDSYKPLGKIGNHIIRPSLATRMPFSLNGFFYVNDVGAYKTTKSIDLFITAVLTRLFAQTMYNDQRASTIGMLNTPMTEGAEKYFRQIDGYAGVVTPLEAFEGKSKIVAVDGFRGNIFLKAVESVSRAMTHRVKHATLVQKLTENDLLLLNKFCPSPDEYGARFKTAEYYRTTWSQTRELLARKPTGTFLSRLDEFFTRKPGSQSYRLVTGENLDEIAGNVACVLEENDFDFRQNIGDKLDLLSYAFFRIMQGVYGAMVQGKTTAGNRTANVAVLSNGEEDVKGDLFAKQLVQKLDGAFFVEPEHLMEGKIRRNVDGKIKWHYDCPIDVVATDRYTAEIYQQSIAAVEKQLGALFKGLLTLENLRAYKNAKGPLHQLKALLNPDGYNGSPILGLNAYALVGHGKASVNAIESAIRRAVEYRRTNYVHLALSAIPEMEKMAEKARNQT